MSVPIILLFIYLFPVAIDLITLVVGRIYLNRTEKENIILEGLISWNTLFYVVMWPVILLGFILYGIIGGILYLIPPTRFLVVENNWNLVNTISKNLSHNNPYDGGKEVIGRAIKKLYFLYMFAGIGTIVTLFIVLNILK